MRITQFSRRTGFILLLFLIPILLGVRFKWDAILPTIIYLQLLIIWAQSEIALRQHSLFTLQFRPFFGIRSERIIVEPPSYTVWIRNTSKNAAYNIMVDRILDKHNRPVPPGEWENKVHSDLISSLAPEEEELLCSFNEEIANSELTIEFSYSDQLNELGVMHIKLLKGRKMLLIPETKEPPGLLLNTLEYFALFFKFMRFKRYFRRNL